MGLAPGKDVIVEGNLVKEQENAKEYVRESLWRKSKSK